mmetsp:Transcript_3228/g.3561  ORF Transcript_3228/g.3561 Transcript_3228/m.3561 type:complete len:183 (+) Transcript_3228:136-684(+)
MAEEGSSAKRPRLGAEETGAVEKQLAKLGITLPEPAAAVANYVPWRQSGSTIFISGQIPKDASGALPKGQLGAEGQAGKLSVAAGQAAARQCGINLIVHMKAACDGNLDRVKRILRIEGFVSCTPEFEGHPQVINGCSDLMVEVFGKEVGSHSRFAVGCSSLPLGVPVEVGAIVEISEASKL